MYIYVCKYMHIYIYISICIYIYIYIYIKVRCHAGLATAQISNVKWGKMPGVQDHTYGSWILNSRSKMGRGSGGGVAPPRAQTNMWVKMPSCSRSHVRTLTSDSRAFLNLPDQESLVNVRAKDVQVFKITRTANGS